MTAEPERAHTNGEVHALVRRQGQRYLKRTPYKADSDASFWGLMDRLMMVEKAVARKPEMERGRPSKRDITCPRGRGALTRIDFGYPGARAEKRYPGAIPIKGGGGGRRRRHQRDYDDEEEETRTERFQRREWRERETTSLVFPGVLHEDQLLDLCSDLTYRIKCIEQATEYAKVLGVKIRPCSKLDLEDWLTEELYQPGPEFAMRIIAFDLVQNLVEQAQLFEMRSRGKEEKAIKYVTIAVILKEGWSEASSGTSQGIANDIKMLASRRHTILRGDVFEPVHIRGCGLHGTESSQSTASNRGDNMSAVTPPIVMRGEFGN